MSNLLVFLATSFAILYVIGRFMSIGEPPYDPEAAGLRAMAEYREQEIRESHAAVEEAWAAQAHQKASRDEEAEWIELTKSTTKVEDIPF